eukprot:scaffold3256_cov120-Skeletonema_menzelii.AAC.4
MKSIRTVRKSRRNLEKSRKPGEEIDDDDNPKYAGSHHSHDGGRKMTRSHRQFLEQKERKEGKVKMEFPSLLEGETLCPVCHAKNYTSRGCKMITCTRTQRHRSKQFVYYCGYCKKESENGETLNCSCSHRFDRSAREEELAKPIELLGDEHEHEDTNTFSSGGLAQLEYCTFIKGDDEGTFDVGGRAIKREHRAYDEDTVTSATNHADAAMDFDADTDDEGATKSSAAVGVADETGCRLRSGKRKKRSLEDGDQSSAGAPRKTYKYLCSADGCTNKRHNGGVCIRHGAKVKRCSSEGCTNQAQIGGVCMRHGAKRKRCSSEGCTNQAVKGGVCWRHGAKAELKSGEKGRIKRNASGVNAENIATGCSAPSRKRKHPSLEEGGQSSERTPKKTYKYVCSADGCTNHVVTGGVCVRHGAKVKLCSSEGCTNLAIKGGVCIRHGAKKKLCSSEGCTNQAQIGGVCMRHGAKDKISICSSEGCTNQARRKGGVCVRHGAKNGAKVKQCSSEGCTNQVIKGGVCIRHGAEVKRCSSEGCTNHVVNGGVCMRHGAKVKQCISEGCPNKAQKGGVCVRHGAKVKVKRCSSEGCTNMTKKGGVCVRHGATVKRCSSEGCTNNARKGGVCLRHGAKVKVKRCSSEGCTNNAKKGGVCLRHGAKAGSPHR